MLKNSKLRKSFTALAMVFVMLFAFLPGLNLANAGLVWRHEFQNYVLPDERRVPAGPTGEDPRAAQDNVRLWYEEDSLTSNSITFNLSGGGKAPNQTDYDYNAFAITWTTDTTTPFADLNESGALTWLVIHPSDFVNLSAAPGDPDYGVATFVANRWTLSLYEEAARYNGLNELADRVRAMTLEQDTDYRAYAMRLGDYDLKPSAVTRLRKGANGSLGPTLGTHFTTGTASTGEVGAEDQERIFAYVNDEYVNPTSPSYREGGAMLYGTGGNGNGLFYFLLSTSNSITIPDRSVAANFGTEADVGPLGSMKNGQYVWVESNGPGPVGLGNALLLDPTIPYMGSQPLTPNTRYFVWSYKAGDANYNDSPITRLYSGGRLDLQINGFSTAPESDKLLTRNNEGGQYNPERRPQDVNIQVTGTTTSSITVSAARVGSGSGRYMFGYVKTADWDGTVNCTNIQWTGSRPLGGSSVASLEHTFVNLDRDEEYQLFAFQVGTTVPANANPSNYYNNSPVERATVTTLATNNQSQSVSVSTTTTDRSIIVDASQTSGTGQFMYGVFNSDQPNKVEWFGPTTETRHVFPNMLASSNYFVYVYAVGDGTFDDSDLVTTPVTTRPSNGTSQDIQIVSASKTDSSISVTVEQVGNGSGMFVFGIASVPDGHNLSNTIDWVAPSMNGTYTFNDLDPGTQYYVYAYALGDGTYNDSPFVMVPKDWSVTNPIVSRTSQTVEVTDVTVTDKTIRVDISPSTNNSGKFRYGITTNPGTTAIIDWADPTSDTFYIWPELNPDTQYYVYVYAVGDDTYHDSNIVKADKGDTHTHSGAGRTNQEIRFVNAVNQPTSITVNFERVSADGTNLYMFGFAEQNPDDYGDDVIKWVGPFNNQSSYTFTELTADTQYYIFSYMLGSDSFNDSPIVQVLPIDYSKTEVATTPPSGSGGGGGGGGNSQPRFTLQTIADMAARNQNIEVTYNNGEGMYIFPATAFMVTETANRFGNNIRLSDVPVNFNISKASTSDSSRVSLAASQNGLAQRTETYTFNITATYGGTTLEVREFYYFVPHYIQLPAGHLVTTGVALNDDRSTLRHIPTEIVTHQGKRYARLNSLTTGTFTVIYNVRITPDMIGHWAEENVRSGMSRTFIRGRDETWFDHTAQMTRAEFTTAVAAALGLQPISGRGQFVDVYESDWYNGYVNVARYFEIISGMDANTFEPNAPITREQAMVILARVSDLIGENTYMSPDQTEAQLNRFADGQVTNYWARESAAYCLYRGIVIGEHDLLKPRDNITRAEVIAILDRLLHNTSLIN